MSLNWSLVCTLITLLLCGMLRARNITNWWWDNCMTLCALPEYYLPTIGIIAFGVTCGWIYYPYVTLGILVGDFIFLSIKGGQNAESREEVGRR